MRIFRDLVCTSGPFVVSLVGGDEGYRPYFENYTVDASILQLIFDQLHKMILKIISQFLIPPSGGVEF
ncbi:hypothetical protein A4X16_17115 [Microbacterium sp. H83]|nr:hypothetical protein A4X16_17115 [Microbacterium sp. H83]